MNAAPRPGVRIAYAIGGGALLIVLAQLIGQFEIAGKAWPPLTDVITYVSTPAGASLLGRNVAVTMTSAGIGFLVGVGIALVGATLALLVPALRPGLDRFSAILHAVPAIALAPLLVTTVGREDTPMVIAALGVAFLMFVTMTSAFSNPSPSHEDVFTVMGSQRLQRLLRLELPRAVPAFFDGLVLCAPAAILGATIGEWFGAPMGIGLLIVSAMQNYQMPLLWAAALAATILSLLVYLIFTLLQRSAARRFA